MITFICLNKLWMPIYIIIINIGITTITVAFQCIVFKNTNIDYNYYYF